MQVPLVTTAESATISASLIGLGGARFWRVLAVLLVIIAVVLFVGHSAESGGHAGLAQLVAGAVAGFAIGVVASLMGVAGGELTLQTSVALFDADVKLAGRLSLALSAPTMLAGFTRYSRDSAFAVLGRAIRGRSAVFHRHGVSAVKGKRGASLPDSNRHGSHGPRDFRSAQVPYPTVLGQTALAHLDVAELALEHPERMLDAG